MLCLLSDYTTVRPIADKDDAHLYKFDFRYGDGFVINNFFELVIRNVQRLFFTFVSIFSHKKLAPLN